MVEAILAEYKTISDLRLNIQVHHVVGDESGENNGVRLRWSNSEIITWLHVVGNEANNCQLDKNDHDGTQVDICDLVITHGDLLEEAWCTI